VPKVIRPIDPLRLAPQRQGDLRGKAHLEPLLSPVFKERFPTLALRPRKMAGFSLHHQRCDYAPLPNRLPCLALPHDRASRKSPRTWARRGTLGLGLSAHPARGISIKGYPPWPSTDEPEALHLSPEGGTVDAQLRRGVRGPAAVTLERPGDEVPFHRLQDG
jgi:hypothetical protein